MALPSEHALPSDCSADSHTETYGCTNACTHAGTHGCTDACTHKHACGHRRAREYTQAHSGPNGCSDGQTDEKTCDCNGSSLYRR